MSAQLIRSLQEAISASCSVWLKTDEPEDALEAIAQACSNNNWELLLWDPLHNTVTKDNQGGTANPAEPPSLIIGNNAGLIRLAQTKTRDPDEDGPNDRHALLVMQNAVSQFCTAGGIINNPMILQAVQDAIQNGGKTWRHLVFIAGEHVIIPAELEKQLLLLHHKRPTAKERWDLAEVNFPENLPAEGGEEAQKILDATAGLTRIETVNAMAISIGREGKLMPRVLWELKTASLAKSGLITVRQPKAGFDAIGGNGQLKKFWLDCLSRREKPTKAQPLGVILLGVAGCGKSALIDALGYELGWPVVDVNMGSLQSGTVGSSEARTRAAIETIEAMGRVLVRLDEVDRMFAGAGSGARDTGVSDRQMGAWLTFMQERTGGSYIVATSNELSKLQEVSSGAFMRAERFDAIFFFDLPTAEERATIWPIHMTRYEIPLDSDKPDDNQWTGAEIAACCRLSSLLSRSLVETAKMIVPTAVTSREKIEEMRMWADKRCLSTSFEGIYTKDGAKRMMPDPKLRRRVVSTKKQEPLQ
jgi:hypothetical protein